MDPQLMPEQPVPVTLHTTMLLPVPLAENWIWAPGLTEGATGEMVSFEEETTVTVAEPDTPGEATDVATTVTVGGEGTDDAAV